MLSRIGLAILLLVALPIVSVFAYRPLKGLAVWWYERDFEDDALAAARRVAGEAEYCIFDDDKYILVSDFAELNTSKMLAEAFDGRFIPRKDGYHPNPHFRLFANGKTYWWSFRERKFFEFPPRRWALEPVLESSCNDYKQDSDSLENAFSERYSIDVGIDNFCCALLAQGND